MPFLNADVPHFYCLIRREYLYDLQSHHGEFEPVAVFGVASIPSRALMFHIMNENGAQFARVPISALCWKEEAPNIPLSHLELWDCFSYDVSVHEFSFLKGLRCTAHLKNRERVDGEYLFTVDWCGSRYSEDPGEGGHKNAHVLKLDSGNFAALPNNRIYPWREPSFITRPGDPPIPDYITNSHTWRCEGASKWASENSPRFFYDVREMSDAEIGEATRP